MLAPITTDQDMAHSLPRDDFIIEHLSSNDFDVRLQMLNRLTVWIKRDPQWFTKFAKKGDLFKQFEVLLADNRWEIQHQCIKFLHDAMPTFGNKVIVGFLLNDKIEDAIIEEALREIPNLLIPEFTNQSWKTLIDGLTKIMILNPSAKRQESVACLLAHFNAYLGATKLRHILTDLTAEQHEICKKYEPIIFGAKKITKNTFPEDTKSGPCMDVELRYRFGIIPVTTSNQLNSESDPLLRLSALEQVKKIINEITFEDKRKFATHLHSYFLTLGNILDDLNFKVISVCLDVLQLTLEKIGSYISPYTQQIVGLVSKHFGSQKLSLKQKIMIICMITMQYSSSKNVISHLCVYSEHRSSRIREEILNIITASLLKFDSSSINLKAIGDVVVPLTVDPKRRVRLAAFELFAVVVHCSNDSVKELLKSVTDLEQKYGNYGLLSAIKVRISRKTLPKIRRDGLIEYATPLDSDVSINKLRYSTENLDYQWIMSGSSESSNMFSRLPTASVIKFPSSNLEESSIKNSEEQVKSLNGSSIKLNEDESLDSRPCSDGTTHSRLNGNTSHDEDRKETESLHQVNQIHLERLDLNNKLNPSVFNTDSDFHTSNEASRQSANKKQSNQGRILKNGLLRMGRQSPDNNFKPNHFPQMGKGMNPDELPIKPTKSGNYCDGYAPSEPSIPTGHYPISVVKKSFSHQNLASTSKITNNTQKKDSKNSSRYLATKLKSASSMRSVLSNASSTGSIFRSSRSVPSLEVISKNPSNALNAALQKIIAEDWNLKLDAIEVINALAKIAPEVLVENIHSVIPKLLTECKNLRSTVSRAAIVAFAGLFQNLKTTMDIDIEKICLVLMQKAGDVSNAFIRDDATVALEEIVKYASPVRVLNALVTSGANSKSSMIRSSCASLLVKLVERVGPTNVICSVEFPRYLRSLLQFAKDANATVRYSGKCGIKLLSKNIPIFNDAVRKSLNESDRQELREILEMIKKRGLDGSNLDASSIPQSGISRSSSSRRISNNGNKLIVPQAVQQDLLQIRNDLIASQWEQRIKGLRELARVLLSNGDAVLSDTKILGAFVSRTCDINAKVAIEAMETLISILPIFSTYISRVMSLKTIVNQLINSLMSHLASRSEEHRQHAKLCLEEITKYIEHGTLLTPFAAATKQANFKQKPFMLQTLSRLNESVYVIKPRQVEMTSLPVLWDILRAPPRHRSDPKVREAFRSYAVTLARCFGEKTLLDLSTFHLSPSQKSTLHELIS